MEIIEHNNIKNFITFGDIHGEYQTFFNILKKGLFFDNDKHKENVHPLIEQEKLEEQRNYGDRPFHFGFDSNYVKIHNKKLYDFTKKIIFVCGDCGFGFNKIQYYLDTFKQINEILASNETFLFH